MTRACAASSGTGVLSAPKKGTSVLAACLAASGCVFESGAPENVACAPDGSCPPSSRCVGGMCRAEPEVRLVAPLDGTVFLPGAVVPLRGEAIEVDGARTPPERLAWSSDAAGPLGTGAALDVQLPGGPHVITLEARDPKGRVGTARAAVRVDRTPLVAMEAPAQGQRYFRGRDVIQLRGSAVDPEDGEVPSARLFWTADGATVATDRSATVQLGGGEHTIVLLAVDLDGGTGSASAMVVVDTIRQLGADLVPVSSLARSGELVVAGSVGSGMRLWNQATGALAGHYALPALRSNLVAAVAAFLVRPPGGGLGYAYAAGTPLGISVVGDMTTEWTAQRGLAGDAVADLYAASYCAANCLSGPIALQVVAAGPAGVSRYWDGGWRSWPAGADGLTASPRAVAVNDVAGIPGEIYAGGAGGAMRWTGAGPWQILEAPGGSPLPEVHDIAVRPVEGRVQPEIWFATSGGPARFSQGVVTLFGPEHGAPSSARAVAQGPDAVWVAGGTGGVWRYAGGAWSRVTGLPSDDVSSLLVDNAGAGWLGLRDGRILVVAP